MALCSTGLLGCALRLSDPVFAFKEIRAAEPTRPGKSLLFGTIVVASWMSGDLDTVELKRIGGGTPPRYYFTTRANLYRAFLRRSVKDGNFVMQVDPGLYELSWFSTSGWGRPIRWEPLDEARPHTRILVTRPGIYDLGTLHVERPGVLGRFGLRRTTDLTPARRAILEAAVAGTAWEQLLPAPVRTAQSQDRQAAFSK